MSFRYSKRLEADLALLTVSLIWGIAFVAQRVAAIQAGVFLFNGLRFLIGALVLLPFVWMRSTRFQRVNLPGVGTAGLLLFGGAALQQWGLRYTTAGNAGFITSLYVILIPVMLTVGWRQWPRPSPRRSIWAASLLATSGLFLLSTGGRLTLNPGDLLELAGALLWAGHVILIGRLVRNSEATHLAVGQYLVCGVLNLLVGLVTENDPAYLHGLSNAWGAIAYTGVFSVGLGYTLQVVGQKTAQPADAAILLSLEAVFAALFGWLWLNEALTAWQLLGCGLMLSGVLLAQIHSGDTDRTAVE